MLWEVIFLFAVAGDTSAATVVDRIAVIVGKHVIKLSDIQRDLRLTEFMNREPLNLDSSERHKSADRLIDQAMIRDEIARGGYRRPADSDANRLLNQLRHDRFGGSDSRLQEELSRFGISEGQLRNQFLWQLTVLSFIDQRFRPSVQLNDDEIVSYYNQHLPELEKEYPQNNAFAVLQPKISALLEGQRINQNFLAWLEQARQRNHIEYRQGAFQ